MLNEKIPTFTEAEIQGYKELEASMKKCNENKGAFALMFSPEGQKIIAESYKQEEEGDDDNGI